VRHYRVDGLVFHIPRELTTLETRAEFLFDSYENVERRFATRYIAPDATVLELGGCLGIVACTLNRRLSDPARHVVFEPHPQIAGHLAANRDRNRCGFQIRRQVIAPSGPATFYLRDPLVGGSSMLRSSERKIDVPTVTLAELEAETGLQFDALVIDIEGAEHAFVVENADFLRRMRSVVIELHPQIIGDAACEDCRGRMRAAGLRQLDCQGCVEAWGRTAPMNSST